MSPSRWSDLDRPPLDARALNRALATGSLWREIRVVEETGSTNADLAVLARLGEPEGLVLVAEYQNAGRGRLDRGWTAPPRSGLSFSMLLRPAAIPPARWSLVPLLVGVAAASAIRAGTDLDVRLKWPNDLIIGDRKVAGILAERVDSPDGAAVVVGVGLNVSLKPEELPVPTAISLSIAGARTTDRDPILRAVLRAVADEYGSWQRNAGDGASGLLARYRELCATLGCDVRVELPGDRTVEGAAVDVDVTGALVIQNANGSTAVSAGDVVHVR